MIYKDESHSVEKRVKDLLARMTLAEKVAQLKAVLPMMVLDGEEVSVEKLRQVAEHGIGRIPQFPMPFYRGPESVAKAYNAIQRYMVEETRLGIPFLPQVECLNGFVAADAASFPPPIALASSFRPDLVEKMAGIIQDQMRAVGARFGLAPVVDLARDPRWGRVYETFGEDTYLSTAFGVAYSKGLQGPDLRRSVVCCAKHFLGYSTTQSGLNAAEVQATPRDLYDNYGTPFEAMFRLNDIQGIMCTYSAIDGKPVSISSEILRDLLRDRMGFTGTAVCDGGSIEMAYNRQRSVPTMKDAGIQALKAGLDADAPMTEAYHFLEEAVESGELDEAYVDEAVSRVLSQKFALGLFDEPYVAEDAVSSHYHLPETDALSKELSDESIILLKNDGVLPLAADAGTVAVIGPHGDSLSSLFAGYSYPATLQLLSAILARRQASMTGVTDHMQEDPASDLFAFTKGKDPAEFIESYIAEKYGALSVAEAIRRHASGDVRYAAGCPVSDEDRSGFEEVIEAAKTADVVVLAMGGTCGWGPDSTSGEGKDRASLDLPGVQEELMREIAAVGKPVILVLFNGRPMSINWAAENVDAILEVWFPGPKGGEAVADVLFGKVNPSGRLPVTVPKSIGQIPIHYNHKAGSGYVKVAEGGRMGSLFFSGGYTDIENVPLFEFGFGLSYTTFEYEELRITEKNVPIDGTVTIEADVRNSGRVAGGEVMQLYFRDKESFITRPVKELVGFRKVALEPGEEKTVIFEVAMSQLGFTNHEGRFVVEPGTIEVMVGASSSDIRLRDEFTITGETRELSGRRTFLSKSSNSER